jgi:hypothetical protein
MIDFSYADLEPIASYRVVTILSTFSLYPFYVN